MSNTSTKKVLIVEDDQDLRKILVRALAAYNYILYEAEDGAGALSIIRHEEPDLILLDLLLPKPDGFEILETVRHSPNKKIAAIPVVVLSNLWTNKDIIRIQALTIEEYYVKTSTNLQDVYKKIEEVLNRKPAPPDAT